MTDQNTEASEELVINLPQRVFVCPKGHRWTASDPYKAFVNNDATFQSGPLCPYCIVAFMGDHFATSEITEEVK